MDEMGSRFRTTRWSVVLAAGDTRATQSRDALATLCGIYWYPLYAFVRRRGFDAAEAQDMTQEFFVRLLEKDYLKTVRPEKGRFRSYLLGAMSHFLANEWDRRKAKKRGGGQAPISLDFEDAEGRYKLEPVESRTPESIFERRWALRLLEEVLAALRSEFVHAGKEDQFEHLKVFLSPEQDRTPYAGIAAALGMSEGAAKVAVHRLRRRYRQLLRREIARTVADPSEVDDEIRYLFSVLS